MEGTFRVQSSGWINFKTICVVSANESNSKDGVPGYPSMGHIPNSQLELVEALRLTTSKTIFKDRWWNYWKQKWNAVTGIRGNEYQLITNTLFVLSIFTYYLLWSGHCYNHFTTSYSLKPYNNLMWKILWSSHYPWGSRVKNTKAVCHFSKELHFVRTFHPDLSILGHPTRRGS